MKLESGDYIEVHYKDFIRQNISCYEVIWGQFIGHDGKGKMIEVKSLTEKEQKERIDFSEYLYTCIESFVCMKSICNLKLEVDLKQPEEYLTMLNMFMAFQANAGRIHDNTTRLLLIYLPEKRANELMTRLYDTYQKRNNVLHGKKLPCRVEDSLVFIAPLKGQDESSKDWHSGMNWGQFNQEWLVFLTDYLNISLDEICKTFNDILCNLIEPIKSIVISKNISIDPINHAIVQINNPDGTIINTPNSTSFGFSGVSGTYPYEIGKNGFSGTPISGSTNTQK